MGEELNDILDAYEPRPRTEAAQALDGAGRVGAIFRFALDVDSAPGGASKMNIRLEVRPT